AAVAASWMWLANGAGLGGAGATPAGAMPGMAAQDAMAAMVMPMGWSAGHAAAMFGMWTVMMIAMMLPNAAQAVLRVAGAGGLAPAVEFSTGYLAIWIGFGAAATLAQWALDAGRFLSGGMAVRSTLAAGLIAAGAGLYQATPLKRACLDRCHRLRHGVPDSQSLGPWESVHMGLRYGVLCLGCCAALMALLFVGGLMNMFWIAAITIWVLAERTLGWGGRLAWLGAAGLVAAGITVTLMALGHG
ncbi:MAG TPA: DUF2182 domain-containing protein, partial [bacterium]|nr:DUF2182 domain-containing protein [bacterium]